MTDRFVLVGMGVTGRAVADAIAARGHSLRCFDDRADGDALASWSGSTGIAVEPFEATAFTAALRDADAVLPTPGLPDHHPAFELSAAAGVVVMSEFDLAARWDHRPAIAVTGTDGKTTVVTLIDRMLDASGIKSAAVGNTEVPWVQAIDDSTIEVFVVEASSFRLGHSQRFEPAVAVWLNFGPDHLDAHRDLDAYERAKAAIWADFGPDSLAVANRDDPTVARHAAALDTPTVATFGAGHDQDPNGNGIEDGWLIVAGEPLVAIDRLTRRLPHDLLNGLAASIAATRMGATRDVCAQVLADFDGLAHRVEHIATDGRGVAWVNDSKATTPHAAAAAIASYPSVVLIAGGRNKGLAFDDMVAQAERLRHVIAIGEAADAVTERFAPHAPTSTASSMRQAVDAGADLAHEGDTVLLSPGCASFDWYPNYAARGDDFRSLVLEHVATRSIT